MSTRSLTVCLLVAALAALDTFERTQATAGPTWMSPAIELLGDLHLATGQPDAALAAFARELDDFPNRAVALLGAARAATKLGKLDVARGYYATLADQWRDADSDLPALAEVRAGARLGY